MNLKFLTALMRICSTGIFFFILIKVVIFIITGIIGSNCLFVWVGYEFAFLHLNGVLLVVASDVGHGAQRMPMPILECNLEVDIDLEWNNREVGRIRRAAHLEERVLTKVHFCKLSNPQLIELVSVFCCEACFIVFTGQLIENVRLFDYLQSSINIAKPKRI